MYACARVYMRLAIPLRSAARARSGGVGAGSAAPGAGLSPRLGGSHDQPGGPENCTRADRAVKKTASDNLINAIAAIAKKEANA
eukprot:7362083-Lingulodinium_polyedra.AAC.1